MEQVFFFSLDLALLTVLQTNKLFLNIEGKV